MSSLEAVTEENFENSVLKSDVPVLVDFWAAWCGPCKALAPKLEELSTSYDGKVKIVKLDVDANQNLAAQFGIRGIPAMILFKSGKMVDQIVGNQPKDVIEKLITKAI
ncbi:thioredoxin [bacterium]|nr:thioredoxin [bacterium]